MRKRNHHQADPHPTTRNGSDTIAAGSDETLHAHLMAELAEQSLDLNEDDLRSEWELADEDPDAVALATHDLLRRVAKDYRQRYLRAAAAEYKRRVRELGDRWVELPGTPAARRDLLAAVLARQPEMQSALLTVQHREFRDLTDHDVESCLAQLAELGMLDEDDGPGEPGSDVS